MGAVLAAVVRGFLRLLARLRDLLVHHRRLAGPAVLAGVEFRAQRLLTALDPDRTPPMGLPSARKWAMWVRPVGEPHAVCMGVVTGDRHTAELYLAVGISHFRSHDKQRIDGQVWVEPLAD